MKVIQLTCPKCNANLELKDGQNRYFCPYCGASVVLDDETITHVYRDEARLRELELSEQRRKEAILADQRRKERYREKNRKWWIAYGAAVGIILFIIVFLINIPSPQNDSSLIIKVPGSLFMISLFYIVLVAPFLKPIKPGDTWRPWLRKLFYFMVNYIVLMYVVMFLRSCTN